MTFEEISQTKGFTFPTTEKDWRLVQKTNYQQSVSFELDNASIELLMDKVPQDRIYLPTLKKIAENIIIGNQLQPKPF